MERSGTLGPTPARPSPARGVGAKGPTRPRRRATYRGRSTKSETRPHRNANETVFGISNRTPHTQLSSTPNFQSRICDSFNPSVINKHTRSRLDKRECFAMLRVVKFRIPVAQGSSETCATEFGNNRATQRSPYGRIVDKLSWFRTKQKALFHDNICQIQPSRLRVH